MEAPSVCLETFLAACARTEPPCLGKRGCPLPRSSSLVLVPTGVRRLWFPEVPGGSGSALGPLSRWLLPTLFRGTVNPLNGLGGNSSSPLLNGSSDAACGALEVAELRPYSGPNHPPTPSQNNNNPSDILAAGGTQAAFVLGCSGDPLLGQQQCPFVRPALDGDSEWKVLLVFIFFKKAEGGGEGEQGAGWEVHVHILHSETPCLCCCAAGRLHNEGLCGSGGENGGLGSQRGGGTPGACGYGFRMAQRKCKFLRLRAAGEKQGRGLFWLLAALSSIFCPKLLKRCVGAVPLGNKPEAAPSGRWVRPGGAEPLVW